MGLIVIPSDRIEPTATPVRLSDEWVEKGLVLAVFGTWYVTPSGMGRLAQTGSGVPNRGSVQGLVPGFGVTIAGNTNSYLTGPVLPVPKTGFRSIVSHFYPRNAGAGTLGRIFQDVTGTGLTGGHEAMYFSAGYIVHNSIGSALNGDATQTRPSTAPTFDRWNSVGVVVDRSLAYNTVPTWYVDGKPSTGVLVSSTGSAFSTQAETFAFGNRPSDVGRTWDGYLGPNLFFDGPLTIADNALLHQNPQRVLSSGRRSTFGLVVSSSPAAMVETLTASDSSSAENQTSASMAETVTTIDSTAAENQTSASSIESVTSVDSQTADASSVASTVESVSSVDSSDSLVTFVGAVSESGAATDISTAMLEAVAAIAESLTAADVVTAVSSVTIGRPASDISAGAWVPDTGVILYSRINEVTPSDAEYIETPSASTCSMTLDTTDFPVGSDVVLSYRAMSTTSSMLTVRLFQGGTTIASWTHALTGTPTLYTQTLSAGEKAAIVAGAISVELTAS